MDDVAILNWHFCMCGNIIVIEEGETEEGRDACEECKSGAEYIKQYMTTEGVE